MDEKTDKDKIPLLSSIKGLPGQRQTLSVSAFIKLHAGELVSVHIESSSDTSWVISKKSSFTFHFVGPPSSIPAYLAQVSTDNSFGSNTVLKPWVTEGRAQLYRSLSGIYIC